MSSNRYGDSYTIEPQVESQFMDRSTLDTTNDSVIIDYQTGVRFKRSNGSHFQQNPFARTATRTTATRSASMMPITPPPAAPQSILHLKSSMEESDSFHSHNFDNQTTYSMRIAETSTQSSVDFQDSIPDDDVPPSEYFKYIPQHFTAIEKMKQFLIWLTLKEIRNQKELPVAVLDSKGQEVLIEGQSKYIQGIINGQVNISWFARPENSQLMLEQQENPINIANRKKLQEQEKAIQLFKDETEDWRNCTEHIYDLHAAATNQMEVEQEQPMDIDLDQIDVDSIIDQLEDEQSNFLQKFDTLDTHQPYKDLTSSIDLGVTQLRQILNTVHQFATRTEQYNDRVLARLARRTKEGGRFVPIQQDRRIPGIFNNSEEKRKISENDSVQDILRLISRLPKKPKLSH